MDKTYSQFAGRSVERLNALSDGLFAIAMTLIVLDIRIPPSGAIHSETQLLGALAALAPQIATYLMSFLTLGIFWVGQQAQLGHFKQADRNLTWIQLAFLAAVAALPFTTHLLSEFVTFRTAILVYWGNFSMLGLLLLVSWTYAEHAGLVADDVPPDLGSTIVRRIVIAQALYAVGTALCVINTYVSMAVIVALQLFFAIGPRWVIMRVKG